MLIGVVGLGVVGKALADVLLIKGHRILAFDIKDIPDEQAERVNFHVMPNLDQMIICEPDVIFICVPTPYDQVSGVLDISAINQVLNGLFKPLKCFTADASYTPPVIAIKSTVPLGTTDTLCEQYDYSFAFVPEFLRQAHAYADTLNPDRIIVGVKDEHSKKLLHDLFLDFYAPIFVVEPIVAEMAKLFSNAFLTTKVAFSQQIRKACKKFNVEYFPYELLTSDSRIGNSHLDMSLGKVPQTSACFPKDLKSLMHQLNNEFLYVVFMEAIEEDAPNG